jgi:hypothetical protein
MTFGVKVSQLQLLQQISNCQCPIIWTFGLFIYSTKACLRGKMPPRLGHLATSSEVTGSENFRILELADNALFKMVRFVVL